MAPPADAVAPTHDVFVSYRRQEPDRSWVRQRFVPALRAGGLKVFLDEDDFRLGEPLIGAMTRGVERSRYTVAVLSHAYLASTFTELESLMAEHLGLEETRASLIGVMREHVTPRLSMRMRLWLDMTEEAEFDDGVARLVHELRTPRPSESPPP